MRGGRPRCREALTADREVRRPQHRAMLVKLVDADSKSSGRKTMSLDSDRHTSDKIPPQTVVTLGINMSCSQEFASCNIGGGSNIAGYVQCRSAHIQNPVNAQYNSDKRRIYPNCGEYDDNNRIEPDGTPAVPTPPKIARYTTICCRCLCPYG